MAAFDRDCKKVGEFVLCAGLFAREQKPHTIDASPSHDGDGTIVRYEWDLDGTGGFERDTGATPTVTHTFERLKGLVDHRKRPVRVRVTDDKGASAEAAMTLTLLEPSCEPLVTNGRRRDAALCLRPRNVEVGGKKVVRWHSERPVTLNGIAIVPAAGRSVTIELPAEAGAPAPRIASNGAAVTIRRSRARRRPLRRLVLLGRDRRRAPVRLQARSRRAPERPQDHGPGRAAVARRGQASSRFALHVALPRSSAARRPTIPSWSARARRSASASEPLSFEVANASIGPIGLEQLKVTFDGEDLWEISDAPRAAGPDPVRVAGDAGIRSNGDFEHAGAEVSFGTPGVGLGPVFLQRIAFRIEIKPKHSKCVPKTGIETIDMQELLKPLMGEDFRIPAGWTRYYEIDHGIPTFALCGEVGLTGGPSLLGAAAIRMDAGLGLATYDDRPAVFRAFGKLYVVELPLAKAAFELHTNGYMKARAEFGFAIPSVASLEGFLTFEMLKAKFNAEAYVQGLRRPRRPVRRSARADLEQGTRASACTSTCWARTGSPASATSGATSLPDPLLHRVRRRRLPRAHRLRHRRPHHAGGGEPAAQTRRRPPASSRRSTCRPACRARCSSPRARTRRRRSRWSARTASASRRRTA